jgi:hypothetical protein
MNPNRLQKPNRAPQITQAAVESILAMRETQRALKDRMELMDRSIKDAEAGLIAQIEAGADVNQCGYAVSIQAVERHYPAWKEHFISKLGKAAADAVMDDTAPVVYQRLVIK